MNDSPPTNEGPLPLRDYQDRIIQLAQEHLGTDPSLLVAAPPGSGKTVVMAEISAMALRKDQRTGLLVHRQELGHPVRGEDSPAVRPASGSGLAGPKRVGQAGDHHGPGYPLGAGDPRGFQA